MNQLITLALVIAAGFLLYGLWRDRSKESSPHSFWKGKVNGRLLQAVKGDREPGLHFEVASSDLRIYPS